MDLERLIDYDCWANAKVFKASLTSDHKIRTPEIRTLFSHLLTAQTIWINRTLGKKLACEIWPDLSVDEIEHLLNNNPDKLKGLIARKDEAVSYQNSKGRAFSNTVEEILTHLTIHGQHHRAQIAPLLREEGITPPATDYIFFLRER